MRRGALIGFGNVTRHGHLPGWRRREDVTLTGVTDVRAERRDEAAADLPEATWYASIDALLDATAPDFVDIGTPPSTHALLVEIALRRGVHVLCEKPLVRSLGDLQRLREQAEARRLVIQTVHNWHHAPIVRRTRELIGDGAVGDVTGVSWQTLRTGPAAAVGDGANWRVDPAIAGGGVLTDHGWHVSYIVQRWIGQTPLAVAASLETRRHRAFAVEDTASVQIAYPSAKADIFLTWAAEARGNWAEVSGTAGVLQLRDDTVVWQSRRTGSEERWACPTALSDGSHHPDWFGAVAAEFLDAVDAGTTSASNLAEAWWCTALEAAARTSSLEGGRAVPVEPWP